MLGELDVHLGLSPSDVVRINEMYVRHNVGMW